MHTQSEKVRSKSFERAQLFCGDIASIVFFKPKYEEPSIYTVRCNQGPRTASFTATRQRRAFLYNSAAKIGINQPRSISSTLLQSASTERSVLPSHRLK
jgi:hypothetical protein